MVRKLSRAGSTNSPRPRLRSLSHPKSRAPGPPRRAELAAPTASRKREGRTAAPARPRLPSGALPATNTNFPKPLPAPGNGGSAGTTRLKGRRRRSPPSSPPLGAPAPPQTFLRPLKVGLGKTRLEIPLHERHSEPPRPTTLESPRGPPGPSANSSHGHPLVPNEAPTNQPLGLG